MSYSREQLAMLEELVFLATCHRVRLEADAALSAFEVVPAGARRWCMNGWRDDPLEAAVDYCTGWLEYAGIEVGV